MDKDIFTVEQFEKSVKHVSQYISDKISETKKLILYPVIQVTVESPSAINVVVTKSCVDYQAISRVDNVYTFAVPEYGTYDIIDADPKGIFTRKTSVNVDAVKIYPVNLTFRLRYGYRIKKNEADPY